MNSHDDCANGVEIRMHGIGDHDLLSALGSPEVLHEGREREPTLVNAPRGVPHRPDQSHQQHRLHLLNWSRVSRSAPSWLWYVAFPFTLVNLAHEMVPGGAVVRRATRAIVALASVAMTMATTVWVLAMVERIMLFFDLPDHVSGYRPEVAAGVCAVLLCGLALVRAAHRSESRSHRAYAVVHCAVVVGLLLAVLRYRPSQVQVSPDGPWALLASEGPTDQQMQRIFDDGVIPQSADAVLWFDALATAAYGLLAVTVLCGAVLWMCARQPGSRAPAAASGLALVLAATLLNLLASALLIGAGQLVSGRQLPRRLVMGEWDPSRETSHLVVGRFSDSFAAQLVPTASAAILVALAVVVVLVTRPARMLWSRDPQPRKTKGERAHEIVGNLPRTTPWILAFALIAVLVVLVSTYIVVAERFDARSVVTINGVRQASWPSGYAWAAYLSYLVALLMFITVRRASSLAPLRTGLALIADVAGFWPITVHPLGARSYRPAAMRGLGRALNLSPGTPVVLVGHSQGSVLCAWLLSHPAELETHSDDCTPAVRPYLVTCGSPLRSLYATFFPEHFDATFFTRVRANSRGWTNFWRRTDPIAQEIGAGVHDVPLQDPAPPPPHAPPDGSGPPGCQRHGQRDAHCHSDYWVDERQQDEVERMLEEGREAPALAAWYQPTNTEPD